MGIKLSLLSGSIINTARFFQKLRREFLFKLNIWTISSLLIGLFIFLPIAEVLWHLTKPTQNWEHLKETVLFTYLFSSSILVFGTAIISMVIGISCAWLVACCEFPGKKWFEWALVLPLAIPTYISAYAYFDILDLFNPFLIWIRSNFSLELMQFINNCLVYIMTILIMSSVLYPYIYLLVRASFIRQGSQLIDAARTLGHNTKSIFWRIILPMGRPAIFAGTSLVIMETLNDYGAVKHFGIPTFTSGIFRTWLGMGDMPGAIRLAAFLMLFILVFLFSEKKIRSRARFSEKSGSNKPFQKILIRDNKLYMAIFCCLIPLALGFIIPVARLSYWAWISRESFLDINAFQLIRNTLFLASLASLLTTALAIILVFSARFFNSKIAGFTNRFAILGYSVPGAVISMGILLLSGQINYLTSWVMTGSLLLLIFAYIVRFMAVAWQPIDSGMERNCQELNNASRTLGSSTIKSLFKINLPLLRNTIITAGLLVFIDTVKELPLTLILRPFNFETLSTATFDLSSQAQIQQSSIPALSIILLVALPLVFLNYRIGKSK
ncbi:MAG: iron ABC transporter permease [Candidatus Marinimicrobia bacterium]|nr:iron ABC transporter permease [Candidatus Neomarinimicrobiota bacterium]